MDWYVKHDGLVFRGDAHLDELTINRLFHLAPLLIEQVAWFIPSGASLPGLSRRAEIDKPCRGDGIEDGATGRTRWVLKCNAPALFKSIFQLNSGVRAAEPFAG